MVHLFGSGSAKTDAKKTKVVINVPGPEIAAETAEETPVKIKEEPIRRSKIVDITDPETKENTRLNALLYHTSNETVDLYKLENNSSDLLGRLYYDDYDSDSILSPQSSISVTPVMSPNVTGGLNSPSIGGLHGVTHDYFQARLGPLLSPVSSATQKPANYRPQSFERGISFDTSTDDHRRSLTFKVKHPQFKFRRNNKTFLAGYNDDTESLKAIEWLFDEMLVHGDTVIILQVLDEKLNDKIDKAKAKKSLEKIEQLNKHNKKVQFVYEIVIGKPQKLLKNAINEFNPQMMIIGTHHSESSPSSSSFLSKSSFSKHFLECALVPVIVVKPTYKYNEYLDHPIDSETYFENLVKAVDHHKDPQTASNRQPSPHHRFSMKLLSPSTSRTSSYTNIASLANASVATESRGRHGPGKSDGTKSSPTESESRSRSRSTSKSRGFSKLFHH